MNFGGAFDLETSVSFQEKVEIYNHQLLGLSYMTGALMPTIHIYCFCSYSWWLYSIQIFKTIVNVANKLAHLRRCKDFLRLGIPLIFRISNLRVSHLPLSHPMAVLQGHFWFWCLFRCKNQKASLDLRWLSNQLHRLGQPTDHGFFTEIHPGLGCVIEFHEKHVFQLYPKNNCCH